MTAIPAETAKERGYTVAAQTQFSDAVRGAIAKGAASSARRGSEKERLTSLGLMSSGYADYLEKLTRDKVKSDISKASLSALDKRGERLREAKYERGKELSLEDKLTSYAIKNDLEDEDALVRYGNTLGIPPERLIDAARNAISANARHKRDKSFNEVHKNIVYRRLTKREAYQYALSLGLSEEDAEALGEIAYKINEDLGD